MRAATALLILLLTLFACIATTNTASAQPTLKKLEDQLRQPPDAAVDTPAAADVAAPQGEPGYLGIVADDRIDAGKGVRLLDVVAGAAAAQFGLQKGDLVTAINGSPVRQMDDMGKILEGQQAGARLEFTVTRDDGDHKLDVTLGRRPPPAQRKFPQFGKIPDDAAPPVAQPSSADVPPSLQPTAATPRLGLRAVPVTEENRRQFNLPSAKGALVVSITVGSPAERAGIPLGAVITALDSQPVTTPDDLARLLRAAGANHEVELTIINRGQESRKRITPQAASPLAATPGMGGNAFGADRPQMVPQEPVTGLQAGGGGSSAANVQALEQRVRELEDRIEKLEALLQASGK